VQWEGGTEIPLYPIYVSPFRPVDLVPALFFISSQLLLETSFQQISSFDALQTKSIPLEKIIKNGKGRAFDCPSSQKALLD
jgi:hypothetical protein